MRPIGRTLTRPSARPLTGDGVSGVSAPGTSEYRRPGGTDKYLRPGGTDLYKRPAGE